MRDDQKRVSSLLIQTVSLLCKNGLHFEKNLHIQGLLGITVDEKDVFIVQIDENLWQKPIDKPLSDAPELNQISLATNENQLIQNQSPSQKIDNQVDNNESFENYNSNFSPRQSESFELKNDNLSRNNDNYVYIKTEMSESMDKKDQEDFNLMTSQEPNQNFHNELVPINQVPQPFANSFHINSLANITQKTVSERGRKKRNHKRSRGSFNLSPIENLENSLLPSYDNFHPYKNDDLVKESVSLKKLIIKLLLLDIYKIILIIIFHSGHIRNITPPNTHQKTINFQLTTTTLKIIIYYYTIMKELKINLI